MPDQISRRAALQQAAAIVGGTTLATVTGSAVLSPQASAAPAPDPIDIGAALRRHKAEHDRVFTGKPSKNGWEMEKVTNDGGTIWTRPIPGTPLDDVTMRIGDVAIVLVHVVRRFHYEIDELRHGDVVGWRSPNQMRKSLAESNQASGTGVQIRPGSYPSGSRGGHFPQDLIVVRDILADCGGTVRWGGDDRHPDEALFYIDVGPGDARLPQVAAKFRGWAQTPGQGAGTISDPLQPRRRRAAQRLTRQQP
jgi:hypothetical protein